jgi:putative endonuclease
MGRTTKITGRVQSLKMSHNRRIGDNGENTALVYLESHGLKRITRNFYSRFGEIDLIMQDGDTTVFVEVKKRMAGIDNAIESITPSKQTKLINTAKYYLSKNGFDLICRFDAIAIDGNNKVEWIKNIILL